MNGAGLVGFADDTRIPWGTVFEGIELRMLGVVEHEGIRVVRNRFAPGTSIDARRHTGEVHGLTISGAWRYPEYGVDYPTGTCIHEPAGSVHTLTVPADRTEPADVLFVMQGANLVLGSGGGIARVDDGPTTLAFSPMLCDSLALAAPPVPFE